MTRAEAGPFDANLVGGAQAGLVGANEKAGMRAGDAGMQTGEEGMQAGPLSTQEVVRLYATFNRRLTRIVRSYVAASETVIEDACQVAWTALLCQPRLDGRVRSWLVRTGIREAARLMHLQLREDSFEWALEERALHLRPAGDAALEEVLGTRERMDDVRLLSARQQRLVWLRAFGFSHDEIAAYEQCTGRTVRRQLERARSKLRLLDGDPESYRAAA